MTNRAQVTFPMVLAAVAYKVAVLGSLCAAPHRAAPRRAGPD